MDIEEYKRLRDMINDALDCGRPIERNIGGEWKPLEVLGVVTAQLRVQPAPPQQKFRPMNPEELEQEANRGTIVEGVAAASRKRMIGALRMNGCDFWIVGVVDVSTLKYAHPDHPKCGQPLQVEITE